MPAKIILVGNLGRDPAPRVQKNAPTAGNAAGANAAEAASLDGGRGNDRPIAFPGKPAFSAQARLDKKRFDTLSAQLALAGLELRVIEKPGGIAYYEVRNGGEAFTVTTLHDVAGIASRAGGATCANLPDAELEAAFPGARVDDSGLPNHVRRAMHLTRAFLRAASVGDYVLAERLMSAAIRASAKGAAG